jgi:hypothetical protein
MKSFKVLATIFVILVSSKFATSRSLSSDDSKNDNYLKADLVNVMSVIGSMFQTKLDQEGRKCIWYHAVAMTIICDSNLILVWEMIAKQLDEDNDGSVSLIDLENFSKIHNVNSSIDSAKFLIEEANARGRFENSFFSFFSS